ncbi:hypothetical protein LTR95_001678 [Oleoguttula sp. CCFEE 5521]
MESLTSTAPPSSRASIGKANAKGMRRDARSSRFPEETYPQVSSARLRLRAYMSAVKYITQANNLPTVVEKGLLCSRELQASVELELRIEPSAVEDLQRAADSYMIGIFKRKHPLLIITIEASAKLSRRSTVRLSRGA